ILKTSEDDIAPIGSLNYVSPSKPSKSRITSRMTTPRSDTNPFISPRTRSSFPISNPINFKSNSSVISLALFESDSESQSENRSSMDLVSTQLPDHESNERKDVIQIESCKEVSKFFNGLI